MNRYWGQPEEPDGPKWEKVLVTIGDALLFLMMVAAVVAIPVSILIHYIQ